MATRESDVTPVLVRPVPVPRALRYSLSSRIGFPKAIADSPLPPGIVRALATWLERGSVLVMSAPAPHRQSAALATWLRTRAERIIWIEGSELRDSGDALDAALDGLYELGVLTRVQRMSFTHLWDVADAIRHENTPIVLVVNNAQQLPQFPAFHKFVELVSRWPNLRFAFTTTAIVDPGIGSAAGVTVLDAGYLRDPLGALHELASRDLPARAQVVHDWARRRDPSGDLLRLLLHLAQFLSVRRDSAELQLVDDLSGVIDELRLRCVIELVETSDGQFISLVSEVREALDFESGVHPDAGAREIHAKAAQGAAAVGDISATIFHLAHAGQHEEALSTLAAVPLLALSSPTAIDAARNAAAAIQIRDADHSVLALAARLQISTIPPLESVQVRDEIQDALTSAQNGMALPLTPRLELEATIAHVTALIARGRFEEARVLGLPAAESLLALPWLDRRELGNVRIHAWSALATASVLEGRVDDASRFARVAQDAALDAGLPYALYVATAALAAIEAQRGALVAAAQYLTEAQRLYRKWGWPRSVAQTVEFVARYYLARAALDVDAMIDLRLDISVVPEPSPSVHVLIKVCDGFIALHTGRATQTRVTTRQLADLIRELRPGALFCTLAMEITFEAFLRFGEATAAIECIDAEGWAARDNDGVLPMLAAAHLALGDGLTALSITEQCAGRGSRHSSADQSLLLLVRASAHEMLGDTELADDNFDEALLTQESSPMPYLFLMVPSDIRKALWQRVSDERQQQWMELRVFLATVPEGVGRADETLPQERLTTREMEILRALSVGGTLEEIAVSQYVSRNTVKTHVRLIYKKLHVNTREGAALVMKRFGEQLVERVQVSNPASAVSF